MSAYALVTDRSLFKITRRELLLFFGIGVTLFATATCYYSAMTMTSVSVAVVLMYTAPIYVLCFSVLRLGERLNAGKIISVIMMLLGCCLVSGIVGGIKFNVWGILIGILSGITYAAYNVITKIAVGGGSRPVSLSIYGFLVMTVIAICVCRPDGIIEVAASKPLTAIPLMIGLGIFTFVTPYFLYTLSMKHLSATVILALTDKNDSNADKETSKE